jgi:PAS domain S-box-containing protein
LGLVRSRIGRRLLAMLLLGVILTFGILAYIIYLRERSIVTSIKKETAVQDAKELVGKIREHMVGKRDFDDIKGLVDVHNTSSDMWISIYKPDGSVYYGPSLRIKLPPRALTSSERVLLTREKEFYVFEPIPNSQECSGCHGAAKRILGVVAVYISTAEIEAALGEIYGKMALVLLVTAVLSILGVLLSTRWMILSPLETLTDAARAVWKGDFKHRISMKRRDEFGGFAETFNLMAEKIENSHRDLEAAVLKRTKDLKGIARLSTEVFRGDLDLEDRMDLFMETVTDELGYDFCTLCLIDRETGKMIHEYIKGLDRPLCYPNEISIDSGHPVINIMTEGKSVVLDSGRAGFEGLAVELAILPVVSYRHRKCSTVQNCRDEFCPAFGHSGEKCWLLDCAPCKQRHGTEGARLLHCIKCSAFPILGVLIAGKPSIEMSSLYPVEVLASEIAAVIDNHQLLDRQRRDIKELIRLHNISLKAKEVLDSGQVCREIVSVACSFSAANAGAMWLLEKGELCLAASFGLNGAPPPEKIPIENFPGLAASAGNIMEVGREEGPAYLSEFMGKNGFLSAVAAPLKGKESVQGCIALFRTRSFRMDDSMKAILLLYMGQAASNLEMVRLYEELKNQRELLRESEEKYRKLIETSNDAIFVIEASDGTISNLNRKAVEMLGLLPKDILGRRILDLHPAGKEKFYASVYKTAALTGKTISEDVYVCSRDGALNPVEISAGELELGGKRLVQVVFRDIRERKKAEDALKESESSYRTLSENLPGIVYRLYPEERRMKFFNDMLEQMTGYRADELTKGEVCRLEEHIMPEDRENVFKSIKLAVMEDIPFDVEYRFRHKSGEIRYFHERGRPVRINGKFSHVDGVIFDITESKRAEEGLRESEEKFRSLAETTSSGIFICSHGMIYANPAMEMITGYSGLELEGRMFSEFIHPAFQEAYEKLNAACMQTDAAEPIRKEFKIITRGGGERWVDLTTKAIVYKGAPALLGTVFDISGRKLMEDALRELAQGSISSVTGEEALRSIVVYLAQALAFDYALVGEFADRDLRSIRTVAIYGKGQILDNVVYNLAGTPCEDADKSLRTYPRDVQSLFPNDAHLREYGIQSYMGTPLFDSAGKHIGILVIMDTKPIISEKTAESMLRIFAVRAAAELERRRREEELKELIATLKSEKEFSEAIFNSTSSGVIVLDDEGRILRLNQPGAEILEYPVWDAQGKNIGEVHPALNEFLVFDTRLNREIDLTFEGGRVKPLGYVNSHLLADFAGETGIIVVFRDLTELKKLQAEIRKKQHFESMGKVISSVAHEIRNPLFAIQSIGQILQRDTVSGQKQALLDAMLKETARMKKLIDELLLFSRPSRLEYTKIDLDAFLEEIRTYVGMKFTDCAISVEVPPSLSLKADRDKLKQVFLNLIDNSAGASSTQVELSVMKRDDGRVRILVRDDGQGIEPTDLERVMEPFFTTKKEGTGLGVPICKKIIEEHGGILQIRSEKGRGTEVEIILDS